MMYHKGGDGKPRGFGFSGFAMGSGGPPPGAKQSGTFQPGHTLELAMPAGTGGRSFGYMMNIGKRRIRSEDDYFDDDDVTEADLEYQPAPGSPSYKENEEGDEKPAVKKKEKKDDSGDDSDDPLESFMAGVQQEVQDQAVIKEKAEKGYRDDIDEEDVQESFFRYMEENPTAGLVVEEEEINVEYDEEGNAIIPEKNKIIDPLPPIDHSEIYYQSFNKNFYTEHPDITALSADKVDELRRMLGIKVSGLEPPKPVTSFAHFGFDEKLIDVIRKHEYEQPMPIQAQGVPAALSGRDVIGIAKTGSGKTAAFIWPMILHIMDQKELEPGDGPVGLILAPTRELSQQIYQEAKKYAKVYNINIVCAYGGGSMWEQAKACQAGAEIIIATPGRLIDLVKKKATNLHRVTFLVYDEADRMLDLGFEPQVTSIAKNARPDKQTLLFSATFRAQIEHIVRKFLLDPIRVIQGEVGEANADVEQIVEILPPGPAKWTWLLRRLVQFTSNGSVLIFVTRKANSVELAANLRARDFELALLHGDMGQTERNEVITSFRKKQVPILVATDVAARGLDIPHIRTVINYNIARDIDTHTHRVGRTGRAGEKGMAYTLIMEKEREFAGLLVRNLEGANQPVPKALIELASKYPGFQKSRFQQSKAKNLTDGGSRSLGMKERPGLGSESSTSTQESSITQRLKFSSGPQMDRLAAMKQAFQSQYKSNFVAAQLEEIAPQYTTPDVAPKEFKPDKKRTKKSRWE